MSNTKIDADVTRVLFLIRQIEAMMSRLSICPRDLNGWVIGRIREFNTAYEVIRELAGRGGVYQAAFMAAESHIAVSRVPNGSMFDMWVSSFEGQLRGLVVWSDMVLRAPQIENAQGMNG